MKNKVKKALNEGSLDMTHFQKGASSAVHYRIRLIFLPFLKVLDIFLKSGAPPTCALTKRKVHSSGQQKTLKE